MLRVAIIGFGGIASSAHLDAYAALQEKNMAKLVAICDIRPEQFNAKAEINIGSAKSSLGEDVRTYTDWKEMLSIEQVDFVDICVPTFLHDEITVPVLNMGFNVLCEKPMALTYERAMNMVDAANKNGKELMIGQCTRFGGRYTLLKELVENKTYGKVLNAQFHRFSAPPLWSWENWYMDYERSHGCITDLHIHDIDAIRFVFGDPKSVSCVTTDIYSKKAIAHSRLMFEDFSILAIGDWSRENLPFECGYTVAFEKATVIANAEGIKAYMRNSDEVITLPFDTSVSYTNEIEYFTNVVSGKIKNTINPADGSARTIKLINTLIESSDNNSKFIEFK